MSVEMESRPVKIEPADAEFYIKRLVKLCELRQDIDAGNLGWAGWWGTDKATDPYVYTDRQGNTKVKQEITVLPIFPDGKGGKGLRHATLHAIFGTRNMLHEMGLGKECDEILKLDRTMPGGKK